MPSSKIDNIGEVLASFLIANSLFALSFISEIKFDLSCLSFIEKAFLSSSVNSSSSLFLISEKLMKDESS